MQKIKGDTPLDNLIKGATKVHYGPGLPQMEYVQLQDTVSDHWRDKPALKTCTTLKGVAMLSIVMV